MQEIAEPIARRGGLVSIDTDGITSLVPFHGLEIGNRLGQWKVEEFDGIIQWQNGVFWLLEKGGNWNCKRDIDSEDTCCTKEEPCWTQKSRGMPRGTVPRRIAVQKIQEMEARASFASNNWEAKQSGCLFRWIVQDCVITTPRTSFAGYRTSMHGFHEERWRTWETRDITYQFGSGHHHALYCPKCAGRDVPMHTIKHMAIACQEYDTISELSMPHKLPWEDSEVIYDDPTIATAHDWEDPEYQETIIFPQRDLEGW
jgi:hypothetical protein